MSSLWQDTRDQEEMVYLCLQLEWFLDPLVLGPMAKQNPTEDALLLRKVKTERRKVAGPNIHLSPAMAYVLPHRTHLLKDPPALDSTTDY